MTGNRKNRALTHQGAELKTRVARTRSRAQFVGIIYFISIILLATAAFLPFFDVEKQQHAPVGVFAALKVFEPASLQSLNTWAGMLTFINALLYLTMLLVVVINVIRASAKLGWLFKKKVSKTYGFNRNVYAMDDLGKIFSSSYSVMLIKYFLTAMLCGVVYPNLLMYIVFIVGALVHVFAGVVGGKVSYFNVEEGQITEDARVVGRFSAFFRNVLQLIVVFVCMDYFQKVNVLAKSIGPLLEVNAINNYVLNQPMAYVSVALQLLGIIFLIPLVKHATATTEYNIDGAYGAGMKTFRVFSFLLFLAIGGAVAAQYLFGQVAFTVVGGVTAVEVVGALAINTEVATMAAIVLGMFFIEVLMRNMPGHKKANSRKSRDDEDDEDSKPAVVLYVYK